MNEQVRHEPTMGPEDGNVLSGQVPTTAPTVRHSARGTGGRFKPRESRIVGPLNKPEGPGGIDSVTGRWIPDVRNNAQLFDYERTTATTARPVFEARDNNRGRSDSYTAGLAEFQDAVNHGISCPGC